jgi:hypothetical protein
MCRVKMNGKNAIPRSNSASSMTARTYNKTFGPQPPSTPRNRPASARTRTNASRFRRMALKALGNIVHNIPNMSNENFKHVVSKLQLIKNFKNFGTLSISNIPVLITAQNSKLRRRQAWS